MTQRKRINNQSPVKLPLPRHKPRKMSRDSAKSEQLREKVYDAVVKTLIKRRSGSFTLDEVAAKIGGSKGIIYYYFKSKGDLLYKLNKYFFDFIEESANVAAQDPKLNYRQKLVALIRNYIITACEHWQLSSVLWKDIALAEVSAGQARVVTRRRREYINYIAWLVQNIVKEEKLDPVDPKVAALMIFGIIVYVPTWYKKGGRLAPEDVANYAVKLVFQGILSKSGSH